LRLENVTNLTRKIAVLRRGPFDSSHIFAWLKHAGHCAVDICEWRDVRQIEVRDDGVCRALLAGIPIRAFDAIMVVGTPGTYEKSSMQRRDVWYRNAERTAALLAALSLASGPRIINPGLVFLWSRQLADPLVMLRRLAACGWLTPVTRHQFQVQDDGIGAIEQGGECVIARRIPDPPTESRRLIVFTPSGLPVIPDDLDIEMRREIVLRTDATVAMMSDLALDWLTVAIGGSGTSTFAYGAMAELPQSLPTKIASRIINASLQ
jgi:hypothetical protein